MVYLALPDVTPQAVYHAPVAVVADSLAKASGSDVRRLEYGICEVTYANLSDSSQAARDDAAWRNRMDPIMYAFDLLPKKRYEEFFGVDRGQSKDFKWLAKWEKSLNQTISLLGSNPSNCPASSPAPVMHSKPLDNTDE